MRVQIDFNLEAITFYAESNEIILKNDEQSMIVELDEISIVLDEYTAQSKKPNGHVFYDEVIIADNSNTYFKIQAKAITYFKDFVYDIYSLWCEDLEKIIEIQR